MKQTTNDFLLFARLSYLSGTEEAKKRTPFSNMQAVIKFHDAIEFCVRGIIEEFTIAHDAGTTLLNLIASVDNHYKKTTPQRKLPLASQISGLNNTRNAAKHHALPPSDHVTQTEEVHSRDFLTEVIRDFIGVEFDSISLVSLVLDDKIRAFFRIAECKIVEGDYMEALVSTKDAFRIAQPSLAAFIEPDRLPLSFYFKARTVVTSPDSFEFVHARMNKIEKALAFTMMGIDVKRFRRFEEITPMIHYTGGVNRTILWNAKIPLTKDVVEEAFNFALEAVLKWQDMGVIGEDPNSPSQRRTEWERKPEWKEIRQEPIDPDDRF